jgi:hypothetical protein
VEVVVGVDVLLLGLDTKTAEKAQRLLAQVAALPCHQHNVHVARLHRVVTARARPRSADLGR